MPDLVNGPVIGQHIVAIVPSETVLADGQSVYKTVTEMGMEDPELLSKAIKSNTIEPDLSVVLERLAKLYLSVTKKAAKELIIRESLDESVGDFDVNALKDRLKSLSFKAGSDGITALLMHASVSDIVSMYLEQTLPDGWSVFSVPDFELSLNEETSKE